MSTALVIENDPVAPAGLLGDWLNSAGLDLVICRPHAGEPLPRSLDGFSALVVMGGRQDAFGAPDGTGSPWFAQERALLRRAVDERVPTLGICLGAQLLALAMGGEVARAAQPDFGPRLIARRDIAERDPLFADLPFTPDVLESHQDEITVLPPGAVLLASSPRCANEAFRIGEAAWGLQFHVEFDLASITERVRRKLERVDPGADPEAFIAATKAVLPDVEAIWSAFAARFAALARGELGVAHRALPVVGVGC